MVLVSKNFKLQGITMVEIHSIDIDKDLNIGLPYNILGLKKNCQEFTFACTFFSTVPVFQQSSLCKDKK